MMLNAQRIRTGAYAVCIACAIGAAAFVSTLPLREPILKAKIERAEKDLAIAEARLDKKKDCILRGQNCAVAMTATGAMRETTLEADEKQVAAKKQELEEMQAVRVHSTDRGISSFFSWLTSAILALGFAVSITEPDKRKGETS